MTDNRTKALEDALQAFVDEVTVPEKHCSCHIAPPCGWCAEHSYMAEAVENARALLADSQPAQPVAVKDAARVLRGGEVVVVDGQAYSLRDLVDASYAMVKGLGSKNPGSDMPPWFYSGSPYADQIKALGVQPIPVPENFSAEWLSQSKPGPSQGPAIWQHYTMALDAVDDRISIKNAALILLDAMRAGLDPFDASYPTIEALAVKHAGNRGDGVIQLEIAEEFFTAALRAIAEAQK